VESERKKLTLTITVTSCEYDPGAENIRISGVNIRENPFVKLGGHHTIEVGIQRKITLGKSSPPWDSVSLERLDQALDPSTKAEVAAILMQEGLANICIVTSVMTLVRAKVEVNIPRKRKGASGRDKAVLKFFEQVLQTMTRSLNITDLKCILLASSGFLKDEFYEYMMKEAVRRDLKTIVDNKAKFLKCHSHSGHKRALRDVLSDPQVIEKLEKVKATSEVSVLNRFFDMMRDEPDRVLYGMRHVLVANKYQAIETLLITDKLFRADDFKERRQYVDLVESVKENSGDVQIFSSLHVTGEQLDQLTGVAAMLRFVIPEIECLEDSEESDDDLEEYVEEYIP